jgi:hypothetical protein
MSNHLKHIKNFISFAAKELELPSLPNIHFVGHEENKKAAFGHSKGSDIYIRLIDRHPIDAMRTIAHELVHYKQNILRNTKGEKMREDDANAIAGRIMRKFGTSNSEVFASKPIEEMESAIPANVMGASSSTHGTGGIDTYDPLLGATLKRKLPDIIGKTKPLKNIKKGK